MISTTKANVSLNSYLTASLGEELDLVQTENAKDLINNALNVAYGSTDVSLFPYLAFSVDDNLQLQVRGLSYSYGSFYNFLVGKDKKSLMTDFSDFEQATFSKLHFPVSIYVGSYSDSDEYRFIVFVMALIDGLFSVNYDGNTLTNSFSMSLSVNDLKVILDDFLSKNTVITETSQSILEAVLPDNTNTVEFSVSLLMDLEVNKPTFKASRTNRLYFYDEGFVSKDFYSFMLLPVSFKVAISENLIGFSLAFKDSNGNVLESYNGEIALDKPVSKSGSCSLLYSHYVKYLLSKLIPKIQELYVSTISEKASDTEPTYKLADTLPSTIKAGTVLVFFNEQGYEFRTVVEVVSADTVRLDNDVSLIGSIFVSNYVPLQLFLLTEPKYEKTSDIFNYSVSDFELRLYSEGNLILKRTVDYVRMSFGYDSIEDFLLSLELSNGRTLYDVFHLVYEEKLLGDDYYLEVPFTKAGGDADFLDVFLPLTISNLLIVEKGEGYLDFIGYCPFVIIGKNENVLKLGRRIFVLDGVLSSKEGYILDTEELISKNDVSAYLALAKVILDDRYFEVINGG